MDISDWKVDENRMEMDDFRALKTGLPILSPHKMHIL